MLPRWLAHVDAQQSAGWRSSGETLPVTTARESESYKKKRAIVKSVYTCSEKALLMFTYAEVQTKWW